MTQMSRHFQQYQNHGFMYRNLTKILSALQILNSPWDLKNYVCRILLTLEILKLLTLINFLVWNLTHKTFAQNEFSSDAKCADKCDSNKTQQQRKNQYELSSWMTSVGLFHCTQFMLCTSWLVHMRTDMQSQLGAKRTQ